MSGSTRTIWLMAVTAVVSLVAGLLLSRLVVSPADAAADAAPPQAGAITVPVERRVLANDVVMRGDVLYEDPVTVALETGDLGGPAVVTGHVPEAGAMVDAGDVLLEVAGRPVLVLTGDLPVYRTLRAGVSGPDVLQLKQALGALGIAAGDPASPVYDGTTAAAVERLYADVGYPAPGPGEDVTQRLEDTRQQLRDAEEQAATARRELTAASAGIPQSERTRLQAEVDSATIRLEAAQAACDAPTPEAPCDQAAVVDARGNLAVALAARDEGSAPPDTSAARSVLAAAQRALEGARAAVRDAQADALTPLPASEVVYLPSTPRRVDTVEVRRGSAVTGTPVMSVSGATLQVAGSVSASDADLVPQGSPATIALPDGGELTGHVESVGEPDPQADRNGESGAAAPAAGRVRVVVVPDALTEEQRTVLQGTNVRVTIPVSSTGGEVLAVPVAALTAGPGGEARVEVMDDAGRSLLVTVETGLAAGGFVEVEPLDGDLTERHRVVVGVAPDESGAGGATPSDDDEAPEDEAPEDEAAEAAGADGA